ncbi:snRNP splicing factor U2AF [Theileria orientalis]|uniref:SnRNP splicing factor U2AF n=1 Tax=Theileria orientalis TaxID=68886 RepID=A0A976M5Y4_THEOR|nr:snRNP splicing factor U2AF [Theileria orientalis]
MSSSRSRDRRSSHSRRSRDRSRGRSRDRHRHKHRRERSEQRESHRERHSSRDRGRESSRSRRSRDRYGNTGRNDHDYRHRRNYRYDSPPKLDAKKQFGLANYASIHTIGSETSGFDPLATRPYREIYIGNIPPVGDISILLDIINQALISVNGTSMPGNPCLKGWISSDGHYAFIELRTMEEASNCMQLTGLNIMGHNIKVNRPKTYDPELLSKAPSPTVPTLDPSLLAMGLQALKSAREQIVAASDVLAAEKAKVMTDRLCIVDIPPEVDNQTVINLVHSMGQVKYTYFVDEPTGNENSKSSGDLGRSVGENSSSPSGANKRVFLFEYLNMDHQKKAMEEIPKMNYRLILAIDAVTQGMIAPEYIKKQLESCAIMKPEVPTRALLLGNLVSKEELDDDAEYVDIIDDVKTECEDYGVVLRLELPRVPKGLSEEEMKSFDESSVGSAFVLFSTVDGASKARKVLDGRKFGNRTVKAHFFSELYFLTGKFGNPRPNYHKEHSSVYNTQIVSDPNSAADILYELENPISSKKLESNQENKDLNGNINDLTTEVTTNQ